MNVSALAVSFSLERCRIKGFLLLLCLGRFLLPACSQAADKESVWFSADSESADFVEMFRQPETWQKARSQINVIKLNPTQLDPKNVGLNSYAELKAVDAFTKLKSWGIKIATEEGAIKEWDCTGERAARITLQHIAAAESVGTNLALIAMDEPVVSGTEACKLSLEEVASRTAAYARVVKSLPVDSKRVSPSVGDIEAYPSHGVEELMHWAKLLERDGFTPDFFHLDINLHYIDLHPEVDLAGDLKRIANFFRREHIPFGIILWSGYDPLGSDRAYYDHTMILVKSIEAAIGRPDQVVFQSWVTRAPRNCESKKTSCSIKDCKLLEDPECGKKSIPYNIPEGNPLLFTHTRLVDDALLSFARVRNR